MKKLLVGICLIVSLGMTGTAAAGSPNLYTAVQAADMFYANPTRMNKVVALDALFSLNLTKFEMGLLTQSGLLDVENLIYYKVKGE